MKLNMNGILIGTENPERLRDYYTKLFGKPNWDDGGYFGSQLGSGSMTVGPHDKVKGKNDAPGRVIWNIESSDVKGQFEQLKGPARRSSESPTRWAMAATGSRCGSRRSPTPTTTTSS